MPLRCHLYKGNKKGLRGWNTHNIAKIGEI